uniref:Putative secreted protein n=2 Tax=Amblyomma cajennense TaxID=34607 RepID=A0A023FDW7_AMBCJ
MRMFRKIIYLNAFTFRRTWSVRLAVGPMNNDVNVKKSLRRKMHGQWRSIKRLRSASTASPAPYTKLPCPERPAHGCRIFALRKTHSCHSVVTLDAQRPEQVTQLEVN